MLGKKRIREDIDADAEKKTICLKTCCVCMDEKNVEELFFCCSVREPHYYCGDCIVDSFKHCEFKEFYRPIHTAVPQVVKTMLLGACLYNECESPIYKFEKKIYESIKDDEYRTYYMKIRNMYSLKKNLMKNGTSSLGRVKCRHCGTDSITTSEYTSQCNCKASEIIQNFEFLKSGFTIPENTTTKQIVSDYIKIKVDEYLYPCCSCCKRSQEKSSACNHMTCPECLSETCYLCGMYFPTMVNRVDVNSRLSNFWRVGNEVEGVTDAVIWTDHTGTLYDFFSGVSTCVMYSRDIFSILKKFGMENVEKILGLKDGDPDNESFQETFELAASDFLRKSQWLSINFDDYDYFEYEMVEKIFPDFPILPTLHFFFVQIFQENVSFYPNNLGDLVTRDGISLRLYVDFLNRSPYSYKNIEDDLLSFED